MAMGLRRHDHGEGKKAYHAPFLKPAWRKKRRLVKSFIMIGQILGVWSRARPRAVAISLAGVKLAVAGCTGVSDD